MLATELVPIFLTMPQPEAAVRAKAAKAATEALGQELTLLIKPSKILRSVILDRGGGAESENC
jgi:hypothetical protein